MFGIKRQCDKTIYVFYYTGNGVPVSVKVACQLKKDHFPWSSHSGAFQTLLTNVGYWE